MGGILGPVASARPPSNGGERGTAGEKLHFLATNAQDGPTGVTADSRHGLPDTRLRRHGGPQEALQGRRRAYPARGRVRGEERA